MSQYSFVQLVYEPSESKGKACSAGAGHPSSGREFPFSGRNSNTNFHLGLVAEGAALGDWGNNWEHAPSLFAYDATKRKYRWVSPEPVTLPFEYRLVVFESNDTSSGDTSCGKIIAVDAATTEPSRVEGATLGGGDLDHKLGKGNMNNSPDEKGQKKSRKLQQQHQTVLPSFSEKGERHVDPSQSNGSVGTSNHRIYQRDVHFWTSADLPALACCRPSTYLRLSFYPFPANQRFRKGTTAVEGGGVPNDDEEEEEVLELVSLTAAPITPGNAGRRSNLGSWSDMRMDKAVGDENVTLSSMGTAAVTALTCNQPSNLTENALDASKDDKGLLSMTYWSATVDIASMEGQRLVLKIDTIAATASRDRKHCHSLSLLPRSFAGNKSGRLALPVMRSCVGDDNDEEDDCVGEVDVSYVFVSSFPAQELLAPLKIIRSTQTKNQLICGNFVGHRGLGSTHMPSLEAAAGFANSTKKKAKLTENTIESLTAAYRRGCDYVEFDVMLTADNVPVVYHDLVLQVHARDKKKKERREVYHASMLDLVELGATPKHGHNHLGIAAGEQDSCSLGVSQPHSLPSEMLSVGVHQLSRRQLEGMQVAPVNILNNLMKLKIIILKHWSRIMQMASRLPPRPKVPRKKTLYQHDPMSAGHSPYQVVACIDDSPLMGRSPAVPYSNDSAATGDASYSPLPAPFANNYHHHSQPLASLSPQVGGGSMQRQETQQQQQQQLKQFSMQTRIPSFADLLNLLPSDLGLMIEIKFPVQPKTDAMLHEQTSHFEVNRFVDAVLAVLYKVGNARHKVAFCSFEPNICIALNLKQCRYPVVFLCDSEDDDQKDYRCFSLDTALQFAKAEQLSGVSIPSGSLLRPEERQRPLDIVHAEKRKDQPEVVKKKQMNTDTMSMFDTWGTGGMFGGGGARVGKRGEEEEEEPQHATKDSSSSAPSYDLSYANEVLNLAHSANLAVWTWGAHNNDHHWCNIQRDQLGVGGVITDTVPDVRVDSRSSAERRRDDAYDLKIQRTRHAANGGVFTSGVSSTTGNSATPPSEASSQLIPMRSAMDRNDSVAEDLDEYSS